MVELLLKNDSPKTEVYPLVNKHGYGQSPFFYRKLSQNGQPFQYQCLFTRWIQMVFLIFFNDRRVVQLCFTVPFALSVRSPRFGKSTWGECNGKSLPGGNNKTTDCEVKDGSPPKRKLEHMACFEYQHNNSIRKSELLGQSGKVEYIMKQLQKVEHKRDNSICKDGCNGSVQDGSGSNPSVEIGL